MDSFDVSIAEHRRQGCAFRHAIAKGSENETGDRVRMCMYTRAGDPENLVWNAGPRELQGETRLAQTG